MAMRCLCRHSHDDHHGLWCAVCEAFCCPPPQDLDETEGVALPPVPRDGQRWKRGRKITAQWDDELDEPKAAA